MEESEQRNLRVVVVEDDANYRASLETLLHLEPGLSPAGSYGSAQAFLTSISKRGPNTLEPGDVVLMDIDLPGMTGIEATRELKESHPAVSVVILTAFEEPDKIIAAIRAGADGYLLKRAGVTEVIEQLRSVAGGGSPMTPSIARSVLEIMRRSGRDAREDSSPLPATRSTRQAQGGDDSTEADAGSRLSEREHAVLAALVNGRSYKQIAADLDLSIHTIRTYLRRVYAKLRVHSATEAVSRALRDKLAR
jgi:DNA-binding NarL/FixJ family response regulator